MGSDIVYKHEKFTVDANRFYNKVKNIVNKEYRILHHETKMTDITKE